MSRFRFSARLAPVLALRVALPLSASLVALWFLSQKISASDLGGLLSSLTRITPATLLLAALLTWLSLWAVGRYDVVAHRHLGTDIPHRQAHITGMMAVSLAQTLGFGLFTGALVRWRMLPGLGMADALRLSGFVCLSFLSALAVILALACLTLTPPPGTLAFSCGVLIALPLLLWVMVRHPTLRLGRFTARAPSLRAGAAILLWATVDTTAAALVLYLLIPGIEPGFATFLPVYLLALGAALLSGAPGGVGPFELVLLGLLPQVPAPDLLAGIVMFRALYYAFPAVLALIGCMRPYPATPARRHPLPQPLCQAPRAEVGVIRQNGGRLLYSVSGTVAVWPTAQSLVALSDPLHGKMANLLTPLQRAARQQNRLACLYKTTARNALAARQAGWCVTHIADEAVLSPANFDLSRPTCRGLRRKLRQAEKAGIIVTSPPELPLTEMQALDQCWQARRGGARAGTMGRFCGAYVAEQRVFLAHQNDRLVAFVTFHSSRQEWCLDLMRSASDMPDGTNHAMILHALHDAAIADIPRLSLAAVPACPVPLNRLTTQLYGWLSARHDHAGLRQFKGGFGPRWQPLYAASSTWAWLMLSLLDIALAVHKPGQTPVHNAPLHKQDEKYEVALHLPS
tara:strand:- start:14848 stop:16731 length:1884 start_codon:yes stop_codon:yes gene_type:complete